MRTWGDRVGCVVCRLWVLSSSPAAAGVLGSVVSLGLDGEGIFEVLQALLQVLNLALLLGQEEVFDPIQTRLDGIESRVGVGKPLTDHVGHLLNGFLDGGLHFLFGCRYLSNCVRSNTLDIF
jgi:hypothetical protein